MRSRRPPEPPENHDRWLVSYADFITLLFAFFVVMYSLSTASEGSYRVLSESIVSAFTKPRQSLQPIQVGELVRSPVPMEDRSDNISAPPLVVPLRPVEAPRAADDGAADNGAADNGAADDGAGDQALEQLGDAIAEQIPRELDNESVNIKRDRFWIEVEISSTLLFPSGSAALLASAVPVLNRMAESLMQVPNRIRVEGFTDDVPIRNDLFPSNWELSAARAAAVVRFFESSGIDPARLSAVAFGEQSPVAPNDTEEGRARNRRVVLVVLAANVRAQDERVQGVSLRQQ